MTAAVVDLLEGAPDLVAYAAAPAQLRRVAAADQALTRVSSATARTAGVGLGLTTGLAGLAMWGSLLVGISAVHGRRLDGVLLAVIVLVPLAAFELVAPLPAATQTLERVRRAAARVFALFDAPAAVHEPTRGRLAPPAPTWLEARSLKARYGDGPWVLDGVDLDVVRGRRVAIVGPSGAGKSTLAAVLLRFLDYDGSVLLDGIPFDHLDSESLRRVAGLVDQEAHLFDTTVAENLRIGRRDASDDELRAALDAVGLLAWLDSLPAGLDTNVGPRGNRVSGGERQRLALARAALPDFPILVLDEPTEHLDVATADRITANMLQDRRDRATVLITHRLSGLEDVDEAIVLDSGRVVERGGHAHLVSVRGRYADLWRREQHPRQGAGVHVELVAPARDDG
jgi:thiol reductant ABC exporter CydC subunit